ncbi:MAG: prolyl oligopeptidase family serine peptidase [Caulobacterales bacterium]
MLAKAVAIVAFWALTSAVWAADPKPPTPTPTTAPAAPAQSTANGPLPISAFFSDAVISDAQLSPGGRTLAYVRHDGDVSAIIVYDLETHAATSILASKNKNYSFDWLRWKGEDNLVAGVTLLVINRLGGKPDGEILNWEYAKFVVVLDREGKHVVAVLKGDKHTAYRSGRFVEFVDELRNDPDHILVQAQTETGAPAIWRADIHTGAAEVVELGDDTTVAWETDRTGAVIARMILRGRDVVIQGRAPGEKQWTEVVRIRPKDVKALADFELLGPAEAPGQLYVAVRPENQQQGDARTVRIYDFHTRSLGPPVWPALKYDVATIVSPKDSNALMGVCYWIDTYHCDFKDSDLQANFRGLDKYFHGDSSLAPVSYSNDGRWWLFLVSGPSDPASYYLYDWRAKTMQQLGALYPDLPPERLGTMERFTYAARDGTSIPAYLTRPPGAPKGPLPLVVIPHGGPEARDNFDFDTWSQFIATRGYLVLQPNYRGSGGYGVAYAEAGYGQWGGRMQDDINDGIRKLVETGQADPARICIFGASYGGYAALIGGALNPELYKCVVSWAGISDLSRLVKTERGGLFAGERSPAYDYDVKAIGDPDADKARLARTSAITYAAHYGPPVLLIHGEDDTTVPVDQSWEMERALKAAGRSVHLDVVKNEDHTGWDPDHEKAALTEVADFIAAHIEPAKLTPADAPPAPVAPPAPAAASQPGPKPQVQP